MEILREILRKYHGRFSGQTKTDRCKNRGNQHILILKYKQLFVIITYLVDKNSKIFRSFLEDLKRENPKGDLDMPTVIMKAKLEKPYEHWVKAFDDHKPVREAAGFKDLYRGHLMDDANTIQAVIYTPSMETLDQFMKDEAEVISEAGHIAESTEITVCTDM